MKRIVALLLVLMLLCSGALADFEDEGLTFEFEGVSVLEEWEGETSDTNKWILLGGKLTNWAVQPMSIFGNLSASLVFKDKYKFEAVPVFDRETIDPLVELDGGLLFSVPNMVATSDAEMMRVILNVCGDEQEIPIGENLKDALRGLSREPFEGAGFETPEEAVEAYVASFNEGNVSGMLSTFAIETYVDNVDAQKYIERIRAVSINIAEGIPASNDYIRSILILNRYGSLAESLFRQYIEYNTPEEYENLKDGGVQLLGEEGAAEAFIAAMSEAPMENWFGKIELSGFLSVEQTGEFIQDDNLAEDYFSEISQRNIQRMADGYGCDELREVPALLKIDGTDYLLCMQCARYGDQWYNISLQGCLATILGFDLLCVGLVSLEALTEGDA